MSPRPGAAFTPSLVEAAEACAAVLTTGAAFWRAWGQIAVGHLAQAQTAALRAARREQAMDQTAREWLHEFEQYVRDVAELPRVFGLRLLEELQRVRSSSPGKGV